MFVINMPSGKNEATTLVPGGPDQLLMVIGFVWEDIEGPEVIVVPQLEKDNPTLPATVLAIAHKNSGIKPDYSRFKFMCAATSIKAHTAQRCVDSVANHLRGLERAGMALNDIVINKHSLLWQCQPIDEIKLSMPDPTIPKTGWVLECDGHKYGVVMSPDRSAYRMFPAQEVN